jgi:transposase
MNARYRQYNPGETYFSFIDPEDIRNHNPLVEAIDSFIEENISVEPSSHAVKNEIGGAPAVHPKMMLKIIFYSYAKGIYSSREMEDRMRWDPSYICLSANQRVDHSTICGFILKYKEEIKRVFSQLVYVMAKMDYITMDFVAVDGTKIRANVSKRFTGDVQDFKDQKNRIEKKIERILEHTVDEGPECKARSEKKLDALGREKEKIQAFLAEIDRGETPPKGKISLTDRDACMVKDKDSKYMGYNCQIAVDEKSHAIIGAEVFNAASDRGYLQPMIEEARNRTGEDLSQTGIGFDAGYFTSENVRYCHDQGLDVYLPEGSGESGVKERKGEVIGSWDCKLEIDGDIKRLTCPGGQVMNAIEAKRDRGNYFYRFHPKRAECRDCVIRARCYQKTTTYKGFSVKKEYFDNLPMRQMMTEKLSSAEGKRRMTERSCLVEHVFGEIKAIFKFRGFLHRGIEKVNVIWELICIGYNFRKLARLAHE